MRVSACQKSLFDKLVDGGVSYPQFAMVTLLRLAACSVPASQFSMVAPRLRTALRFACAVFRGCALRFAPCARHFSPSGLRCSQAHSRLSLLHWAHRRLLHPQFAMVVLLRPTACSTPASQFSMVASLRSQSSLEMLPASLGSSAAIAATGCAASFALIGLPLRLFPPLAAAKLRPSRALPGVFDSLRASSKERGSPFFQAKSLPRDQSMMMISPSPAGVSSRPGKGSSSTGSA